MNATGVARTCAVAAVLAVLTTTGCQSEPRTAALGTPVTLAHLPADEIVSLAMKDMRAEHMLNMDLNYRAKGVEYDIRVRLDQQANCHVRSTIDDDPVELMIVDRKQYVRFSPDRLRRELGESETADALYAKAVGKWILLGTPDEEDAGFCDREKTLTELEANLDGVDVDGTANHGQTVRLRAGGDSIYVSILPPHLISYAVDADENVLRFANYDMRSITKPEDDFVVKIPGFSPDLLPV